MKAKCTYTFCLREDGIILVKKDFFEVGGTAASHSGLNTQARIDELMSPNSEISEDDMQKIGFKTLMREGYLFIFLVPRDFLPPVDILVSNDSDDLDKDTQLINALQALLNRINVPDLVAKLRNNDNVLTTVMYPVETPMITMDFHFIERQQPTHIKAPLHDYRSPLFQQAHEEHRSEKSQTQENASEDSNDTKPSN